ncbi:MAG: ABC transporter permease subunit [Firmicutes bacterium]|nr:ABC transporter permease subunit [Bacillota bacterium]
MSSAHTSAETLMPVRPAGWRTGLFNLARKELAEWFGGFELVKSISIWIGLINGILLMAMLTERASGAAPLRLLTFGVEVYTQLTAMFVAVGVAIAALDAIIGERDLGTAAFILSKPLSRVAFILAKFVSNATGILVTAVLIPGMVAYAEIWAIAGSRLSLVRFPIAMLILFEGLTFNLALTLLLGAFFRRKSPVIGIPLALLFGQDLLISLIPELVYVTPWGFTDLARAYVFEGSLTSPLALFMVPATVALMLAVSIVKFQREDL